MYSVWQILATELVYEITLRQHTVCGEAMAVLICFHLLVLIEVALSVVTTTPEVEDWIVHSSTVPSSRLQKTLQDNQNLENQHGYAFDESTSWNEPAYDTEYAFVAAKTKEQCREEVTKNGYKSASEECKGKLKYEKRLCELQAESKGVVPSDCKGMVDKEVCQKKADCKNRANKCCCWVPGSSDPMQCVTEVPVYSTLLNSETKIPKSAMVQTTSRSAMLGNIRNMINSWFVPNPKTLYVVALPVGQGDCITMYCPNGNMAMFDCGSSNRQNALTAAEVKSVILNKVKKVTIFISHDGLDACELLPTVFSDTAKVDQVIIGERPDDCAKSDAIKQWMQTIANQGKLYAINGFSTCIGDCNAKLQKVQYQPQSKTWVISGGMINFNMDICGSPDVNFDIIAANVGPTVIAANVGNTKTQKSIVLKARAGARSVLLPGTTDFSAAHAIASSLQSQLNGRGRLQSSVLQIPRHEAGTKANTLGQEWVLAVRPQQAFVSHAHIKQNLPHCDTIQKLLAADSISTRTLLTPSTHPFSCAKSDGSVDSGKTCHDIFSTSPTPDSIGAIAFEVSRDLVNYNLYFWTP